MIINADSGFFYKYGKKIMVFLMFVFSFFSEINLAVSIFVLYFYFVFFETDKGAEVKTLIFITARQVINKGLGCEFGSIGTLKWIIVIGLSVMIIFKNKNKLASKVSIFISWIAFFAVYLIIVGFYTSSYPVTAAFKVFSWAFVFCSVIIGVGNDEETDYIQYVYYYLSGIILFSPISWLLGIAYLRNGVSYQGITNQPNMFGILSAMTFIINLYIWSTKKDNNKKKVNFQRLIMVMCVFQGILSKSRTGIFCMVIAWVVYMMFSVRGMEKKLVILFSSIILGLVVYYFFGDSINAFIYKGQSDGNILHSREGQLDRAMIKYNYNKWFGSGFMVPYNPNVRSYKLDFDLVAEPGNLFISLLGDTGIVGTILFFIPYLNHFLEMDKSRAVIYAIPFILSMGEMAFFSTNNIAIFYYVLFATCFDKEDKKIKKVEFGIEKGRNNYHAQGL